MDAPASSDAGALLQEPQADDSGLRWVSLRYPVDLAARLSQAVVSKLDPYSPADSRQIWDLWYMPGAYCYLISSADKILNADLLSEFRETRDDLLTQMGLPRDMLRCSEQIHLYINGCFQGLHNDSTSPGYSYVLYLQRKVRFTGGQTYLFTREFPDPRKAAASHAFYEQVEPVYGQMLLFNNDIPHMVPVVQGTMNPIHGRITLCSRLLT